MPEKQPTSTGKQRNALHRFGDRAKLLYKRACEGTVGTKGPEGRLLDIANLAFTSFEGSYRTIARDSWSSVSASRKQGVTSVSLLEYYYGSGIRGHKITKVNYYNNGITSTYEAPFYRDIVKQDPRYGAKEILKGLENIECHARELGWGEVFTPIPRASAWWKRT